jgi:hypothetical protein
MLGDLRPDAYVEPAAHSLDDSGSGQPTQAGPRQTVPDELAGAQDGLAGKALRVWPGGPKRSHKILYTYVM